MMTATVTMAAMMHTAMSAAAMDVGMRAAHAVAVPAGMIVPAVMIVVVPRIVVAPMPVAAATIDDTGAARIPAGAMPPGVAPATAADILHRLNAIKVGRRGAKRTAGCDRCGFSRAASE